MFTPLIVFAAACGGDAKADKSDENAKSNDSLEQDLAMIPQAPQREPSVLSSTERSKVVAASLSACPAIPKPAVPTAARQEQVSVQLQLAQEADVAGDARGVRDALRRAEQLDGTDEMIALRLGRANEELKDVSGAKQAYCRYLSLAPNGKDAMAVRERLGQLVQPQAQQASTPATQYVAAAPRRSTQSRSARKSATTARYEAPERTSSSTTVTTNATTAPATQPAPAPATTTVAAAPTAQPSAGSTADSAGAVSSTPTVHESTGEVVTARPAPPRESVPQTHTVRNVAIGATVGAIAGAVVNRSVKGAVIGAATGGLLGGIASRQSASRTYGTPTWH